MAIARQRSTKPLEQPRPPVSATKRRVSRSFSSRCDRTLADRRRVRQRDRVTAIVLVCPACGADRLIPLTFSVYQRETGPEVVVVRPMAKCSGCGERIFAKIVARQRVSKPH